MAVLTDFGNDDIRFLLAHKRENANVAVKWLWPEPGYVEARKLLKDDVKLGAPSLIRIEVAVAILLRFRDKTVTKTETHHLLSYWGRILQTEILRLIPVKELFDTAVAISLLAHHRLADCFYVATGQGL
jgi:predicted nucleic acid-binding protein